MSEEASVPPPEAAAPPEAPKETSDDPPAADTTASASEAAGDAAETDGDKDAAEPAAAEADTQPEADKDDDAAEPAAAGEASEPTEAEPAATEETTEGTDADADGGADAGAGEASATAGDDADSEEDTAATEEGGDKLEELAGAGTGVGGDGDDEDEEDDAPTDLDPLKVLKDATLSRFEKGTLRSTRNPRFFALLPSAIAFFAKRSDADISEDGILQSPIGYDSLSKLRSHGANIPLTEVESVEQAPDDACRFFIHRTGKKTKPEDIVCESEEAARSWIIAIETARKHASKKAEDAVKSRRTSVLSGVFSKSSSSSSPPVKVPPKRRGSLFRKAKPETMEERLARIEAEREATVAKLKGESEKAAKKAALATAKAKEKEETSRIKAMQDEREKAEMEAAMGKHRTELAKKISERRLGYTVTYFPGPDLGESKNGNLHKSPTGLDAAVLRGWMTRPSKGGVRAGQRERYFVLTPSYLAYFVNEKDAKVTDEGYLSGKCSGKATSKFKHEGANWPLETIVSALPFLEAEKERESIEAARAEARAERERRKAAKAAEKAKAEGEGGEGEEEEEEDDDASSGDEDDGEEGDGEPSAGAGEGSEAAAEEESLPAVSRKKSLMSRMFKSTKRLETVSKEDVDNAFNASSASYNDTLIEIDLGTRVLHLQAWNEPARDAWVAHIKQWSDFRRQVLDDAAFAAWSNLAVYRSGMAYAVGTNKKKDKDTSSKS